MDIIKLWRNELNIVDINILFLSHFPTNKSQIFFFSKEKFQFKCVSHLGFSQSNLLSKPRLDSKSAGCSFHDKSNMLELGMHSMCIAHCQLGLFCNDRNVYMGVVDAEGITLSAGLAGSSWPGHLALGCDWYSVPRQSLRGPAHRHCPPCTAGSGTCSVASLSNK